MKKPDLKNIWNNKKFRHGGLSAVLAVIVVAVAVLLNVGVSMIETRFNLSVDMSKNQMFSISEQTKRTLSSLDEPVKIYGLMRTGNENVYISELMDNYRKLAPDYITTQVVDPVQNPTFARQFTDVELSENSVIITNEDGSKVRAIDYYDMFELGYDSSTYSTYARSFKGEQKITNAITFVTADSVTNAYFLSGHKEVALSDLSYLIEYLEGENLAVSELPGTELSKLQQGDILIIASPQTDLTDEERQIIKEFLENDGYMLYMTDPGYGTLPNFESLIELYNVTFNHDVVMETSQSNYYNYPTFIVPNVGTHESVSGLTENSQVAVLPYAQSFTLPQIEQTAISVEAILTTSEGAYGKTNLESTTAEMEDGDIPGPLTVGLVIREVDQDGEDAGTKIVLLGNSNFVTNQSFYGLSGNTDLFLGSVKWMMGQSDTVTIVGKNLLGNSLRFTSALQMYVLSGISILGLPLVVLVCGMVVWLRRRHL